MAKELKWPRFTQKQLLFAFGLLGFMHELVIEQAVRPAMLALLATMLGLPAFMKVDERAVGPKSKEPA